MRTDQQPIRITLYAPKGRMGRAIAAAVDGSGEFAIDEERGDVLVDFSSPDGLRGSLDQAVSAAIPILVGTTGLNGGHHDLIAEAAETVPVLVAPNTSLGVALLAELVELAAQALGPEDWDVEIVETHHRLKKDAPSGTALFLGKAVETGRGFNAEEEIGRVGTGLERTAGLIGYSAVRGGTVPGDHDVLFLGPEERIILSHRAEDRSIFARGALVAVRFLAGQKPGLYTMRDVIGAA
jgi:4-hydroxy-tetrahydrodipicolinate reductase